MPLYRELWFLRFYGFKLEISGESNKNLNKKLVHLLLGQTT